MLPVTAVSLMWPCSLGHEMKSSRVSVFSLVTGQMVSSTWAGQEGWTRLPADACAGVTAGVPLSAYLRRTYKLR